MTEVSKLNVMHKQIIMLFSGSAVQKVGEIVEGWEKEDHNHIQHTSDVLENRITSLRNQFEHTDLAKADQDQIKSFEKMLESDLKNMIFNIQNDKLPDELVRVAKIYLNDMKDMVTVLKAALD